MQIMGALKGRELREHWVSFALCFKSREGMDGCGGGCVEEHLPILHKRNAGHGEGSKTLIL